MTDATEQKRAACAVREGRFVEPCAALAGAVDNTTPSFSRVKGVAIWGMVSMDTGKPSRTYFGVKTKRHPNGLLFNVCPWCGVRIDTPFAEDGESVEGEE